MNKLLQTIKESDKELDTIKVIEKWRHGENNTMIVNKYLDVLLSNLKSHITQSRIRELGALVQMIEKKRHSDLEEYDYEDKLMSIGYNTALMEIIEILQDTIKQLKNTGQCSKAGD